MGKLKRLGFLTILFCACTFCFANQISFQIVQHDESQDSVSEDSMTIEDAVLNSFFESGYIVTNSDAAISNSENQDEKLYKIGTNDAFNGYSDFFVQIKLFYERTEQTLVNSSDLYKIDFVIAKPKTGTKIAQKTISNIKVEAGKKNNLVKISSDLVNQINKALRENKA